MAIPRFDETMLPILKVLSDGQVKNLKDVSDILLRDFFQLTEEEKRERVSNGYSRFFDRVGWGRTYLKKAGLLEQPERGKVQITPEGIKILSQGVSAITVDMLGKYHSFLEFQSGGKDKPKKEILDSMSEKLSPQDMIDSGFQSMRDALKSNLQDQLLKVDPYYFEKVVLILFQKMGYGDFQETPKSSDGGVDGIISQDKLGLDKIYIQAKRYSSANKVRELDIRNFIGAMSGDVSKGMFVTTSSFDEVAVVKAQNDHNHKIVLIDGNQLADLMIDYGVGIQITTNYEVKEIDNDFFEST